MPRHGKKQSRAPALDPDIVSAFHNLILDGHVNEVQNQLTSTPRLSNSKNNRDVTPLMASVMTTETPWQTQVQLIDTLMKRGASLTTRNTSRYHVLLLACAVGAAPEVIDCLLGWSTKRGGVFQWEHCTSEQDGALVLAARRGSLALVSHLLSFADVMCLENSSSNAPIKIIDAAIASRNEKLVLFVINHEKLKDKISDETFYISDADSDGDYDSSSIVLNVEDCVKAAYNCKMFEAVHAIAVVKLSHT